MGEEGQDGGRHAFLGGFLNHGSYEDLMASMDSIEGADGQVTGAQIGLRQIMKVLHSEINR
jgi:hypothetical protein